MTASLSSTRYRRPRSIVCYWDDGKFVLCNFATNQAIDADPLAAQILHAFVDWRTAEDVASELDNYDLTSLQQAIEQLVERTFLKEQSSSAPLEEEPLDTWSFWNPAAGLYHFSTKDDLTQEIDLAAAEERLRTRFAHDPPPPATKTIIGDNQFQLPEPALDGDLPRVLLTRRTWRRFATSPLEVADLATLLGLTWRVQRWADTEFGPAPLKTSPSAGARHPLEAYVLATRVSGVAHGLYHYNAVGHSLSLIRPGANATTLRRYIPNQWWYESAAAVVFMTAVFSRTQWRYRYPKAYRAVLVEAGHFCQTFCLVATALQLAPFCTLLLSDRVLEQDLGVDGTTESVVYAAGVGTRPAGVDWAPWP